MNLSTKALFFATLFAAGLSAQTQTEPAISPSASLTAAQLREDLKFAREVFLARDRSFSPAEKQSAMQAIERNETNLDRMSREQVIVSLANAAPLSRNAHTRLYILRNRSELRRYPIRVWWFSDGLFVVRASPKHRDLIGAKVRKIGGRNLADAKRLADPLFAGNVPWLRYMSTYTLTSPEILIGLGISPQSGEVEFEFADNRKQKLRPEPLRRSDQPTEAWWDLFPTRERVEPWVHVLPPDKNFPLYLTNPDKQYWSKYLADDRVFYIHFNRSGNAPTGENFEAFSQRILAEIGERKIGAMVVDLRFNTGGNLDIAKPFFERLAAAANEKRMPVYVITGQATFSAGIYHAMQLKELANAKLVGEDFGDDLDFWSEGGNLVMPNSRLTLHFADRYHSYSADVRPEVGEFLIRNTDLSIKDGKIDGLASMSSKDYFSGRDPPMDAVIKLVKK